MNSILWHCILYTPVYGVRRLVLRAETCCSKLFKMKIKVALHSIYYRFFVLFVCLLPSNCRNRISHCCGRATVSNQNKSEADRFSSFDDRHGVPVIVLIHQMAAKCKSTFVMQYSVI